MNKPLFKNIKLFVFDLDGTLLNNKSLISKQNLEVCHKWQKSNHRIAIATGRTFSNAIGFAKELNLHKNNGFLISNDGGEIFDFKENKKIFSQPFKKTLFLKIWSYFQDFPEIFLFFFDNDNKIMYHNIVGNYNNTMKYQINYHCFSKYTMTPRIVNQDFLENHKNYLFKLLVIFTTDEQLKNFKSWTLKNQVKIEVFAMGDQTYEITPHNITKGNAILKISSLNNWKTNEVVVAGDNGNDISMFKVFPNSFASSNCNSIIKPYVKNIFPNDNNNHIAKMIDQWFNSK